MTRTVSLLRVTLTLASAGGVTAPENEDAVDLPLAREPDRGGARGRPYVPPSSLAGALRAHLGPDAPDFLGAVPGRSDPAARRGAADRRTDAPASDPAGSSDDRVASPVRLLGSDVTLPEGTGEMESRSTAIDPRRAAARKSTLRTGHLLPAGTTVHAYLRCDDRTRSLALARRILDWHPVLGRGRTIGRGRATVVEVAVRHLDLARREHLAAWLLDGRAELFPAGTAGYDDVLTGTATAREPELRIRFRIVDALAVGGPESRGTRDSARPVLRHGTDPVVPGSSWKGVLRGRCAYILRSCGSEVCPPETPCGTCPVCRLFGATRRGARPGESTGAAGILEFSDAVVRDAEVRVRNHVAIDRFTGGARTGLLYKHEAVVAGTLTAEIHARQPIASADRGLLLLAVRDIDDGLLGVGGATTRGYGTLELDGESRSLLAELDHAHPVGEAVRDLLGGPR